MGKSNRPRNQFRAEPKGPPPVTANLAGRPKKWDGESLDELAESLDAWIDAATKNRDQFWWWDWCWDVGLNQSRVAKIAETHAGFRRSYENARYWQESVVARHALTKKFSEGFSKFMLVNHYGERWKDKAYIDDKDKAAAEDMSKQLNDFMDMLKHLQLSSDKALKMEDTKIKDETKS